MRKLVIAFVILIFGILPIGCTNQTIKTESENRLTIEDIKSKYNGGNKGQISNLTIYLDHYVLVEYTHNSYTKGFDFYNLKTGDKDTLISETGIDTKLERIESKDSLVFITDGVRNDNGHKYFPQIIKCYRTQEVLGDEGEFKQTLHEQYLKVDQGVDMGQDKKETIADIKVSLDGLEVLFEPTKGEELDFYTAYTSIPFTETSYNKDKNQIIVEFRNTNINNRINKSHIDEENRYISSIDIGKDRLNTILKINLKDVARYYSINFSHLEPQIDDFPYLDFVFASEFEMD